MKNQKILISLFSSLLALAIQGNAQTLFQVTFKGTCQTTNDAGEIVTQQLNNKSLINDALLATGVSNASPLTLVYVQNANPDPSLPADMVQVINNTNGVSIYTNLQFSYGGLFGPSLTNFAGSQFVAGADVFPFPLGSANPTGRAIINEQVTPKKVILRGTFAYTVLKAPAGNETVQFCNGTFTVGKPVSLP